QQDGITLYASSFVQPSLLDELGPEIAADPELSFAAMAEQMFETASKGGALAVRLFDAKGQFQMASPSPASPRALTEEELAAMRKWQPITSFERNGEATDVDSHPGPVLRALIPLKAQGRLVGAAEFVLDGHNVAVALRELDRDMWVSSVVI